jgi:hypothetical protein
MEKVDAEVAKLKRILESFLTPDNFTHQRLTHMIYIVIDEMLHNIGGEIISEKKQISIVNYFIGNSVYNAQLGGDLAQLIFDLYAKDIGPGDFQNGIKNAAYIREITKLRTALRNGFKDAFTEFFLIEKTTEDGGQTQFHQRFAGYNKGTLMCSIKDPVFADSKNAVDVYLDVLNSQFVYFISTEDRFKQLITILKELNIVLENIGQTFPPTAQNFCLGIQTLIEEKLSTVTSIVDITFLEILYNQITTIINSNPQAQQSLIQAIKSINPAEFKDGYTL